MSQEAKILLGIAFATIIILFGAIFIFSKNNQPSANSTAVSNSQLLVRADSHQTASPSANLKITIVEFGDYQCPACAQAYPATKQILNEYKGKVNFVFRNFPLPQHQNAMVAAEAAEASSAQGQFWQMLDKLYENQNSWANSNQPIDLFTSYAKDLGLDINKFQADVKNDKFASIISEDQNDGNALSVNATPTFFLNGQKITGAPSYNQLKNLIDNNLDK